MDTISEFLSQVPVFSSLPPEDLAQLAVLAKPVTREEGQIIFRKGDAPHAMYLVRAGKVDICVWTEENQEVTLSELHEGDFFGELSLLDGLPRTAAAKAVDHVELMEITKEDFLTALRANPDMSISVMEVLARRLRATNELIEQRASRNVNDEIEEKLTFSQRVADRLAQVGGSWYFIGGFFVILAVWTGLNAVDIFFEPFDPFPYIFLNFILAVVAALQAPVIMMSQNRDAQKDRLRADLDYQVNLKAELQIQSLHVKLDDLRVSEIHELRAMQQEQAEILKQLVGNDHRS
jgi:CRP/FNR family cyclic AMP-dependent transcriptional regulator